MSFEYAPYYCEENIYRLADSGEVPDGWVVFVYATSGACPVYNQRAGGEGQVIFWDYHVVYAGDGRVWDLDSVYGPELSVEDWVRASFPLHNELPPEYRPVFRMVERGEFVETFSSDRSHMRNEEGWFELPPDWPAIFDVDRGMNLDDFRTPGTGPGREVGLTEFARLVSESASELS